MSDAARTRALAEQLRRRLNDVVDAAGELDEHLLRIATDVERRRHVTEVAARRRPDWEPDTKGTP